MHVSFTDETKEVVNAVFDMVQDPEVWPFQDNIDWDDPRFQVYYDRLTDWGKSLLEQVRDAGFPRTTNEPS